MNAETVGEHTVKFEDKALKEGIIHMLKGNSSKHVWVTVKRKWIFCKWNVILYNSCAFSLSW